MSFWQRILVGRSRPTPPLEGYGYSPDQPILCHAPAGEREYIARLRCPAGHALHGRRSGSFDGKCPDAASHDRWDADDDPESECIVDRYELTCEGGEYSCALYFDMYHPEPPAQHPPEGLRYG